MSSAAQAGQGRGFGKVILLGEHAVVYGYAALVAGIAQGVALHARPQAEAVTVHIARWGLGPRDVPAAVIDATRAIIAAFGWTGATVTGDASVPAGAGLGSSAAYCVALARACAAHDRVEFVPDEIIAIASRGEASFHGTPSGVDVAAATYGQLGTFRKGEGFRPLAAMAANGAATMVPPLVVGMSGIARATATMIERVAARAASAEGMAHVQRLGALATTGIQALARGHLPDLGAAMFAAHETLAILNVSHPALDAMVQAAHHRGALGAKLTGAGGGGSAIALAPGREDEIAATWQQMGYSTMMVTLGATP
ncbi:MAG: mevalonate kinase [Myxococcales bacterium]|nr:mevalonate kinase [Myxococcales bacterium]